MSFKDWIGDIFGFNNELDSLTNQNTALKYQIKDLETKYSKCNEDSSFLGTKYKELEEKYIKLTTPDPQETLWNNKYPKQDITYRRKEYDGWYNIDVRNYFQPYDSSIPIVSGTTNDEKALNALNWVKKNITYTSDTTEYGEDEFWAYAYQTLKRKKGDCEDGAILLSNIMLKSGIPYWRIRLNAGDVKGGGHAYVTYCRETDNEFVVLDWCYWYKDTLIKDRKLHKDEQDYYGIWFSWNLMYSFGKMETMAEMPKDFNLKKGKSRKSRQ